MKRIAVLGALLLVACATEGPSVRGSVQGIDFENAENDDQCLEAFDDCVVDGDVTLASCEDLLNGCLGRVGGDDPPPETSCEDLMADCEAGGHDACETWEIECRGDDPPPETSCEELMAACEAGGHDACEQYEADCR